MAGSGVCGVYVSPEGVVAEQWQSQQEGEWLGEVGGGITDCANNTQMPGTYPKESKLLLYTTLPI
jgi:hypothetical protein